MMVCNWLDFKNNVINRRIKAIFSYKDLDIIDVNQFAIKAKYKNSSVAIPIQTHSVNVKKVSKAGNFCNVDGLFTSNSSILCSIKVADCMPVFFIHKTKFFYGIVHVGWRGLVGGILRSTLKTLGGARKIEGISSDDISWGEY